MNNYPLQLLHFTAENPPEGAFSETLIAEFLFRHLEEFGDPVGDISKCIDFSMKRNGGLGGRIILALAGGEWAGVTILNRTGMSKYIPENILVYIAVDSRFRGKGFGKALMQAALDSVDGDIALHVEPENPARFLYEKLGFTSKYLEMRYERSS